MESIPFLIDSRMKYGMYSIFLYSARFFFMKSPNNHRSDKMHHFDKMNHQVFAIYFRNSVTPM